MRRAAYLSAVSAFVALLVSPASVFAATTTVYPGNMNGWTFIQESPTAAGSGTLVEGPDTPSKGTGSANLVTNDSRAQVLAKSDYSGKKFSEISTLKYSTYKATGGSALAIALQFDYDNDVTDTDNAFKGRVVYEPYHTQTVNSGQWQTWNTLDGAAGTGTGNWWLSRGSEATAIGGCSQANPCTMSELLTKVPNAGIRSTSSPNVWLKAGSGAEWDNGFNGNVDALTINSDVYDFEAAAPKPEKATNKDQCKNGNWGNFQTEYKNQGDCVSSVASDGKAKGNPTPVDSVVDFFRSMF